jgi:hypothetical protein
MALEIGAGRQPKSCNREACHDICRAATIPFGLMTISESLQRRARLLFLALAVVWLAVPVSFFIFGASAETIVGLPWPIAVCAIAFGTVMFLLTRLKCPKCSDSLYGVLDEVAFSRTNDAARQCPNCRADYTQAAELTAD